MESSNKASTTRKLLFDPDQCLMYGSYIRASRAILGLSQADFCEFLGVTRSTLVRLENGIAPLKKSLCESAVDVLKTAGIQSQVMDQMRYTPGVQSNLDIYVNYGTILSRVLRLPKGTKAQIKVNALFGDGFKAPLKEAPLRKSKKSLT